MKKTITRDSAVALYIILSNSAISRLDTATRCAVVLAVRELTPIARDYDETKEKARAQLSPLRDSTGDRMQREEWEDVERRYLMAEVEVDLPLLKTEQLDALIRNNDYNTSHIILLENTLKSE